MLSVLIKLAVLALVIKEIWLLMGVPAISDAVLSFVLVGAIPGTNHTLSPDDILRWLPLISAGIFALMFRKQLVQFFRRTQLRKQQSMQAYAVQRVAFYGYPKMPIVHPRVALRRARIHKALQRAKLERETAVVIRVSIQLWQRARPYLEQFDKWLNRKAHEYEFSAFLIALFTEMVVTFKSWTVTVKAAADQITDQSGWDLKARKSLK